MRRRFTGGIAHFQNRCCSEVMKIAKAALDNVNLPNIVRYGGVEDSYVRQYILCDVPLQESEKGGLRLKGIYASACVDFFSKRKGMRSNKRTNVENSVPRPY